MTGKTSAGEVEHHGTASPLARFAAMAESIPEVGGEGMDSLIASVVNASKPEDLSRAWESMGTEDLIGKTIQVTGIKRAPSDYEGPLGVFLVVEAVDIGSGELVTFTTGAVSVVLQLVKAHAEKWFPLDCVIQKAARPTKDGYYPLHLKVMGVSF